jgi:amino acid transporter
VTLSLFSSSAASHAGWVTLVGAVWFLVMAYFVARGVRITANAQWIMSSIEVVLLVVFGVLGIFHHHKLSFSPSWLGFSHFGSFSVFVAGALLAAFYYWGWDVSSNLGEETEESKKNSGVGGIVGVLIVFLLFELFTICINMTMSQPAIQSNSSNVLEAYGRVIGGGFGAKLMIVAVALSTIATLETTLIQVTRSLFAMAREKTLPAHFGVLHPKWNTPVFATIVVAVVSLAFFALSNLVGSIGTVLTDAFNSIGLQIAIYYALAGFTAVVAFRKLLLRSVSNFLMMGVFPFLGAAFMTFIFIKSIPGLSTVVLSIGLGGMALGVIPIVYYYLKGADYLHQRPTLGSVPPDQEFPGDDIARID